PSDLLLVFAYIYDQTPAFDRTQAMVTLYPRNCPRIEIGLDERHPQARSCAVMMIENVKDEIIVRREVKFVYGFQAEIDRLYGWGLQWGRGFKTKVSPAAAGPARGRPRAGPQSRERR